MAHVTVPDSVTEQVSATAVADVYYAAYNARDFDLWSSVVAPDVDVRVDTGHFTDRDAALVYTADTIAAYPGIGIVDRVVRFASGDTVVSDFQLGARCPEEATDAWNFDGVVCEILRVEDGTITAIRSFYDSAPGDRIGTMSIPSRFEAGRIAQQQHALRAVATLAARGVPVADLAAATAGQIAALFGIARTLVITFPESADARALATAGAEHVDDSAALTAMANELERVRTSATPIRGRFGRRPTVIVPVRVDGRTWGCLAIIAAPSAEYAEDVDTDLAAFAEVLAIAIRNSRSRAALERMADEQFAVRQVAELVAHGTPPEDVAAAVADRASRLLLGTPVEIRRRTDAGPATIAAAGHAGPDVGSTAVEAPIVVDERIWGHIVADIPRRDPAGTGAEVLDHLADLVAAAIVNADSKAKLSASRARVIATADRARRRLQRDVHDAAQQRLVHAIISLKLAREASASNPDRVAALVDDALRHAERANDDLRDVVHGILPAALSAGGLRAGIESLTSGMDLPIRISVTPLRLPRALEMTAYFIVAEALTNVVKHADARSAEVRIALVGTELDIVVRDDGRGGADVAGGSGILGLHDRVEASEGRVEIVSSPASGTVVHVTLPLGECTGESDAPE